MSEVELKFDLPRRAGSKFAKLEQLGVARPSRARLLALYFDTPDGALARGQMALRLRRSGSRWKQTLKSGRSGEGGLHARDEWEFERPDASIDLALFAHTPLAQLCGAADLHNALKEVFRVEVTRTTWEVEVAPGTRVEVALDQGEVRNADGASPVSEVEIEILEGEPREMFDFAGRLLEAAPLRPSAVTKAERGYRLVSGEKAAPVKARAARLDAGMTPIEAARATIASALAQLQANETGALHGTHPEYLHQMRVAMRRLRSALRAFRDVLDREFVRETDLAMKAIARATGAARDWDVLATQTLPAMLDAGGDAATARSILANVKAKRRAAREAMRDALRSPRYAKVILGLARWLAEPRAAAVDGGDLTAFASRVAAKRHRKLVERARHFDRMDAVARHKLRIEAKRVRYIFEGFAPLFRAKPVKAYLKALAQVQDDLGEANDAVVAKRHLDDIAMSEAIAKPARESLEAREREAAARLAPHFEHLAATKRFWEKD
jgi:inorganic triphosphatase YgiF